MAYPTGHIETFVLTVGTTPVNVVTGTTSAPTTADEMRQHKGIMLSFQNQHATNTVKVGGANVDSGGIQIANNFGAPFQIAPGNGSFSALNAAEWWVVASAASTTVVVQLIHSI